MSEIVNTKGGITQKAVNELVFVPQAQNVAKTVRSLADGRRIFAVTDENVARLHPEILPEENVLVLPAGEDSKTLGTAEEICRAMLAAELNRGSLAVAYGGGVVGDLAGFAASVYMRGIDFINVPTTLLSQVDSAIGGKTGVNLDGYKNMIGSFKMPSRIVICPEVLGTLPEREWRCGMGELIKTAALDSDLYAYVNKHGKKLAARDPFAVEKAVTMAATFKKSVTDEDPTEQGRRVILNFGHTVGHALEKCDDHRLSHGEYVLLGMAIEMKMTGADSAFAAEMEELFALAGMPALPDVSAEDVVAAARADKKNGTGQILSNKQI
ncbi:MAG: 3-dehydroquinate synthase [Clostridiales bacterium]|nr:3-dehydroquinate synthase [Clostridiales bacterium]